VIASPRRQSISQNRFSQYAFISLIQYPCHSIILTSLYKKGEKKRKNKKSF
jgi:hypothetical protein